MATLRLLSSRGGRLLQSSSRALGSTTLYADAAVGIMRPLVSFDFSRSFSSMDISSTKDFDDLPNMTNDDLADTSTIPGWDLIHSPPRKFPRGALVGTVVSDKMQKTVNVAVDRYRIVPKIRKRVRYTRKFMAHDELEVANTGDLVMITPCHRLSKHKHFMVREIIRPKGQL
jgi:small subunit ribosomal protein S17